MKQKNNNIFTILFTIIIIFLAIYYLYKVNKKNIYKNFKEYKYEQNKCKYAIENNLPIEEKLNVIVVISNPCLYNRRYKLLKEFEERILKKEKYVSLYIVELAYGNQNFAVTDKNNPNHLQLRTITPLWHKENMINLGVKYLLPKDYKAFAWIDADIEFENKDWALDTLKILNGKYDVIQLFSHAILLDKDQEETSMQSSFGHDYIKYKKYEISSNVNWTPGFAWAMTRKTYEKIGGLYDKAIIGGGDSIMAFSIINGLDLVKDKYFKIDTNANIFGEEKGAYSSLIFPNYHVYLDNYYNALAFQEKCNGVRLGYIQGTIKHYFHGTYENRKYKDRHEITKKYNYSHKYLKYDNIGLLIPTDKFPNKLKGDIMNYFIERKEDD